MRGRKNDRRVSENDYGAKGKDESERSNELYVNRANGIYELYVLCGL